MTQAFAVSEQIDRPVEEVWTRLTDWSSAPEWMPGVEAMEADGPTTVGTTMTFWARGKERPSEITAVMPGRSVTLSSSQGNVTADYTYTCEPVGDGTRVSLIADCSTKGFLLALVGPLLRLVVRRTDSGQISAFKRVVEAA